MRRTTLIGGGSLMAPEFIQAVGPSIVGFRICYPDVSPDAMGKAYPALVAEYTKMFGEAPISGYHGNAYDAAEIAIKAIEKVAHTGPDGCDLYRPQGAARCGVRVQVRRRERPDRLRRAWRLRDVQAGRL